MTEKKPLKVVSGVHYDQDTDSYYHEGDTSELPAVLLDLFPWSFEEVGGATMTVDNESSDNESADDAFDAEAFVDRTPWSTVVKDIKTGDYDENLDEIEEAERNGRDREKVKDVIESYRDQAA